jgi:ABC-type bacteriocin/lantibiotic exporter with double-glycine peptidase domain
MINNVLMKYIVEAEQPSDGGLESLFKIIKFYNGTSSINDLNYLIQKNYPKSSFKLLIEAAKNNGLIAVHCKEVTINDVIEYNQPLLIKFFGQRGDIHFVFFKSFSALDGFHIWDSRKGYYSLTKENFKQLWHNNDCIAFVSD